MQSSTDDIRAHKSEQCGGFMCVSNKRKTRQAFFASRLIYRFRAVRRNPLASPIKEKRLGRFSTLDFKNDSEQCGGLRASPITQCAVNDTLCVLIRNRSRLPYLLKKRTRYESSRADKRKTARLFFAFRLLMRFRAVAVCTASVPCNEG